MAQATTLIEIKDDLILHIDNRIAKDDFVFEKQNKKLVNSTTNDRTTKREAKAKQKK